MIERLVFGCGHLTGGAGQNVADRLVAASLTGGLRRFDTAPLYGLGTAERALGRALKRAGASDAVATTKIGLGRAHFGVAKTYLQVARRQMRRLTSRVPNAGRPTSAPLDFADPALPRGIYPGARDEERFRAEIERSAADLTPARVVGCLLHEAYPDNLNTEATTALRRLQLDSTVAEVGLANGCAHGDTLERFAPADFVVQAAAPPTLFLATSLGDSVLLDERHIIHSIPTSFRALCSDRDIRAARGSHDDALQ